MIQSRVASKTDILQALTLLSALPKPKGMPTDVIIAAYEIALDRVPAEQLAQAATNLLRGSKYMPSPSELYSEIKRLEQVAAKPAVDARRYDVPDRDVLTPGQKLGYPLLSQDPAARERCNARWAELHPKPAPKPASTDEQRLEQLMANRDEPLHVTDALLKALKEPMR